MSGPNDVDECRAQAVALVRAVIARDAAGQRAIVEAVGYPDLVQGLISTVLMVSQLALAHANGVEQTTIPLEQVDAMLELWQADYRAAIGGAE